MDTSEEINLNFGFDKEEVQICNFNSEGELILWCTCRSDIIYQGYRRYQIINIVCVYSIRDGKSKCRKIYKIPTEAEIISITNDNKIWLRLNNDIYEWDIYNAYTTIILHEVINKFIFYIAKFC